MKALTKMTNCTRRAKKVEGHDKIFVGPLRRTCTPTFKYVPVPLIAVKTLKHFHHFMYSQLIISVTASLQPHSAIIQTCSRPKIG